MDRKTYNRGVMDLLVGLICGAIMTIIHFSIMNYFVISGSAVVAILFSTATDSNLLPIIGNDKQVKFIRWVVLAHIITISVGVVIGYLVMSSMAF